MSIPSAWPAHICWGSSRYHGRRSSTGLLGLAGVPEELAARLEGSDNSYVVVGSQTRWRHIEFDEGDPAPGGRFGGIIEFARSRRRKSRHNRPAAFDSRKLEWEAGGGAPYRELADRILEQRRRPQASSGPSRGPSGASSNGYQGRANSSFTAHLCADLDTFLPRRNSVEIMDQGGTGNRAAVYGTPFGLWAMWFAVIDRAKLKGSIRNGAMSWHDRAGRPTTLYRFSVHKDYVGGDIWRTGTLYLLPKEDFEPIPFYPGGPASNEWASTTEVRPLARLTIDPGDFPFLDQVGATTTAN